MGQCSSLAPQCVVGKGGGGGGQMVAGGRGATQFHGVFHCRCALGRLKQKKEKRGRFWPSDRVDG